MKYLLVILCLFFSCQATLFAGPLDGSWINRNEKTPSIFKVEIRGNQFSWWAAGSDEINGPYELTLLGSSVSDKTPDEYAMVVTQVGFGTMTFVIRWLENQIVIETLTVFKSDDKFKRSNYFSSDVLNLQK
ncbi:MAG: hypothetical protein IPK22_15165 [Verrucomicrobiaceae bacterium]|nr:hypothetical protein [Verrucomicrobiaceae bacterium]